MARQERGPGRADDLGGLAALIRIFGDITLAEDAVQEAFAVASDRWRSDGVPPNPAGWIVTTARNRAIDDLRRSARGRGLHEQLGAAATTPQGPGTEERPEDGPVRDDQLRLIFTCCHPALRTEHHVALTLRLLGGLSVEEVARSFLVSESAMAKRLVRAKYKIKAAKIPYRVPEEPDLPERLRSVLSVLYLIYNTGLDGPERAPLRSEAIRLAVEAAARVPIVDFFWADPTRRWSTSHIAMGRWPVGRSVLLWRRGHAGRLSQAPPLAARLAGRCAHGQSATRLPSQ
jgi:RNA polymerase sigma-70 factor, ECF subfamily